MSKHGIHIQTETILNEKYKVLEHIATGGMSEVYLVKEINNENKIRAIKISNMENKLARKLVDETKILSELEHVNLPNIIDFFTTDQYYCLVMEYIDGMVLSDYFTNQNNQLPTDMIIEIGIQLCDVLHYLHHRPNPIVYRDIKPGNLMIMEDGTLKLIDFGIARRFQANQLKDTVQIGTVGFAAPEQFEKRQTDKRTDLFSLGALLYYFISQGNYVYIAQKPMMKREKSQPKSLIKCVNQLVKLQPDDRLQDAREAKILLLKAREEWEKTAERKWNKPSLTYMMAISISLLAVCYLFFILFI